MSPFVTDLLVSNAVKNNRFPDVEESKTPTATTVHVGIDVKSTLPELEERPEEEAVNVATCLAYEPPVTSVPDVVFVGMTV